MSQSETLVTYTDWYGTTITESIQDMIGRINKLEETEASLRKLTTTRLFVPTMSEVCATRKYLMDCGHNIESEFTHYEVGQHSYCVECKKDTKIVKQTTGT